MPDIYRYFGFKFYFWANEHNPIHVHIEKNGRESKAIFIIEKGAVVDIEYRKVSGIPSLTSTELKTVDIFLKAKQNIIISRWIDWFVYNRTFKPITITKRIK